MSYKEGLLQWQEMLSRYLPHLSRPQRVVLASWSYATVTLGKAGISCVSAWLALMDAEGASKPAAWRQRLREWCYDACDKKGAYQKGVHRQEIDVRLTGIWIVRWLLAWWDPTDRRLPLAIDASSRSSQLTWLCVSVLYRGQAIPVAWKVLPAGQAGSWHPYWKALLEQVKEAVPQEWWVVVMADRGLYSHRLFDDICALGWHPLLRIRASGTVKRAGREHFEPLKRLVPADGSVWAGEVLCFARQPLACTLLAVKAPEHQDTWLLVTDLPVGQGEATWYAMRYWIEPSFRQFKRGGWQWQASRMQDAHRAERSLLVLTVSTLWSMSAAPQAEQQELTSTVDALPATHVARTRKTRQSQPAVLSQVTHGRLWLLFVQVMGAPIAPGRLVPGPWPAQFSPGHRRQKPRRRSRKGKGHIKRWQRTRRARDRREHASP